MKDFSGSIRAALAALALGVLAAPVSAETWRFATKMPADSPEGLVFQYFADRVEELSGGDFVVQVFPSEQLGTEAAILEQLELGTVNLYAEDAFFLQKWVPDIRWISMPFMFPDREKWQTFMHSDLVKGWFAEVEATAGIRPLGDPTAVIRGPYRVLVSSTPVAGLEDIGKMRLRMYPDQLAIDVWTYLGADLRMLAWTETYEGLKSGIATATTSPAALVESMRHYEVAPYISRTNEYWQGIVFAMNAEAFDGLSEEYQQILLQAHADAGAYSAQIMTEVTDKMQANLEGRGVTFVDFDIQGVVDHMAGWYDQQQAAGALPEGLLEAARAASAQ
ncbi:hypothetical protein MASR1M32_03040 [Rhodobacter sp.]